MRVNLDILTFTLIPSLYPSFVHTVEFEASQEQIQT